MSEVPPTWILQHPAYAKIQKLGVDDAEQVHAAFLVYMNLTEVRRWKEVSCLKSAALQLVLLEGKEKEDSTTHSVLPLPARRSVSHNDLREVLERGFPTLLCAVAADSTLVYQRLNDGPLSPEPPAADAFRDARRTGGRKRKRPPA
ncbi:tRNA-splicing endonuclease subunit Sen15 [Stigmatopora nigra]